MMGCRHRLLILFSLLVITMGLSWWAEAQVRPDLDPAIPAYSLEENVSGKFTVAGSDTMKPLVQAWAGELARRHPAMVVTVDSAGSQTGMTAMLEHRAAVAAMSRRMTAKEIAEFVREYGFEPTEVPVAVDALALFVHRDNPIAGLSLDVYCSMM